MQNKVKIIQADNKYDLIIVGGGAAGLMAASFASAAGANCLLLEQKKRTGTKILITGKGRCNITNDCAVEDLFTYIRRNPRFLYSAIYSFTNYDIVRYFNELGVKTKVERGGRVFPVSDKASEVATALLDNAVNAGTKILTGKKVVNIKSNNSEIKGVFCSDGSEYNAKCVILACGGATYPTTGSDGSGYELAALLGHTIIEPRGSLTGLETKQTWVNKVSGLTLKNVGLDLYREEKCIFSTQGEMLITHFGVSGPIVLTASAILADEQINNTYAMLDLKPALDHNKLDLRVLRDFDEFSNKQFSNSLNKLLPSALIDVVIELSGIQADKKVNQITSAERKDIVSLLKGIRLDISGTRPIEEAIITAGGVDVKQINPSTMESKIVKGLYFCGEMIDVDADTGGYNLTIAFATGRLAGLSAAESIK